jgi:hypothetical protein
LSENKRLLGYFGLLTNGLPLAIGEERIDGSTKGNDPVRDARPSDDPSDPVKKGVEKLVRIVIGISLLVLGCSVIGWGERSRQNQTTKFILGFVLLFSGVIVFAV